jgi:hypothetical protein
MHTCCSLSFNRSHDNLCRVIGDKASADGHACIDQHENRCHQSNADTSKAQECHTDAHEIPENPQKRAMHGSL